MKACVCAYIQQTFLLIAVLFVRKLEDKERQSEQKRLRYVLCMCECVVEIETMSR